jgi:nitrogen fixation protein NifX
VDNGHDILDLLNEVSLAMVYGGLSWVDRAKAKAAVSTAAAPKADSRRLMASLDELE